MACELRSTLLSGLPKPDGQELIAKVSPETISRAGQFISLGFQRLGRAVQFLCDVLRVGIGVHQFAKPIIVFLSTSVGTNQCSFELRYIDRSADLLDCSLSHFQHSKWEFHVRRFAAYRRLCSAELLGDGCNILRSKFGHCRRLMENLRKSYYENWEQNRASVFSV